MFKTIEFKVLQPVIVIATLAALVLWAVNYLPIYIYCFIDIILLLYTIKLMIQYC